MQVLGVGLIVRAVKNTVVIETRAVKNTCEVVRGCSLNFPSKTFQPDEANLPVLQCGRRTRKTTQREEKQTR